MDFKIEAPTEEFLRKVEVDLSRVRQWIEGFEAAGGDGPPHADCLRQAQVMLGGAKKLKKPSP